MADRQPIALIIDDEPDICNLISMTLQRMNMRSDIAMSVAEALRQLEQKRYDFCLTDMKLPDGTGLEVVEHIQDLPADSALPVAVITAHGNMDTAIAALKLGAFDFVSKPVNLERLRNLVQLALRLNEARYVEQQEFPALLQGQSPAIQELRKQIEKVARSDAPVLIFGETGSGKELAARCIHQHGPRAQEPFIPVYCASIAPERLEEILFGNESEAGLIHSAHGGSLFLDEVASLPPDIQVKLLRVIQEKRLTSQINDSRTDLDIRILSASNKPLANEVREGRFRSDLYYCINVIELHAPPLRKRLEDIPLLVRDILRRIPAKKNGAAPKAAPDAISALQVYQLPGNLRELENILERAVTLCERNTLHAADLLIPATQPATSSTLQESSGYSNNSELEQPAMTALPIPKQAIYPGQFAHSDYSSLDDFLQTVEREAIENTLNETDWNRTAAAEKLGISFRSLRYRLKKLGLENE
ncbi:sigma-54-dependent transcriptional regulator [Microbulbifer mangrovi]|uniref:sigma-54-dependent transcriptional regulator n=1 Tax=Microbulbifer mangrovi TaxID=927787 RepID=UPI0009909719|nr:sigma-54 dependent transcriptional regulator [Microbulbifer mangrovi]